jgi:hypothetical protein
MRGDERWRMHPPCHRMLARGVEPRQGLGPLRHLTAEKGATQLRAAVREHTVAIAPRNLPAVRTKSPVTPKAFCDRGVCGDLEPHASRAPGASLAAYPTPGTPSSPWAPCVAARIVSQRTGRARRLVAEGSERRDARRLVVTVAAAPHAAHEHTMDRWRMESTRFVGALRASPRCCPRDSTGAVASGVRD